MEWHWWGDWWPWAEANQGFLSLLALIFALAAFLVENRRANRVEEQARDEARRAVVARLRDHVTTLQRLIRVQEERCAALRDAIKANNTTILSVEVGIFNQTGRHLAEAARAISLQAASSYPLILATLVLARTLDTSEPIWSTVSVPVQSARLDIVERGLQSSRDDLAALMPKE